MPVVKDIHSILSADEKKFRNDNINERWGQLYSLENEWGNKALRYLFLTNSGGAIATLSFMGAFPEVLTLLGAKISLVSFFIGILLVGVVTARQYHHMSDLFKAYRSDVEKYYADKIEWLTLLDQDSNRTGANIWDTIFPYSSWFCFLFGCCSGLLTLFQ